MDYPIGDMLIRMKNAARAGRDSFVVPYSGFIKRLGELLVKSGYLEKMEAQDQSLKMDLKYKGRRALVSEIKLFSKPGLRNYIKTKDLNKLHKSGRSLIIISTSLGLMSLEEAKKQKVGGELLCEVS
ncbi:MAG: 30S ribosomal protein S8 [Candidatus Curtissbacteria bacterium]|nr:30S ribosomal protein S8 [bacterium]MDZ4209846.1 30S ribosomal protein S8 [Candidatus Curtissbacteria bacterium]